LDLGEEMNKNSKNNDLKDKSKDKKTETYNYTLLDKVEDTVVLVCGIVLFSAANYFFMKHS